MPRIARVVVPDMPYHITQRGNRRERIFFLKQDYQQYLNWLKEYADEAGLKVYAYCLMTNHVHLVVMPEDSDALAQVFKPLHMRYAQRINRQRHWKGHLWQGRFFSTALDENYLLTAVRYVECNPVRAGMVERAEDYKYSSARVHCAGEENQLLSELSFKPEIDNWSNWLREKEASKKLALLRRNTEKGLPTGSNNFIKKLERKLKRFLRFRPPGRPKRPKGSV